jgi:multidrug resistance efflux pump
MTPFPRAINLRVRPLQSVDLCFPVDGIISDQSDIHLLGTPVTAFDLPGFYSTLGQTVPADPSRLKFDSQTIRNTIKPSILFELRAEPIKAALDKAIVQRQNSYFQKYNNQVAIIEKMQQFYSTDPTSTSSKSFHLGQLANLAAAQHKALNDAYNNNADPFPHNDVVKKTTTKTMDGATDKVLNSTDSVGYDYKHPRLENDAQLHRAQVSLLDEQFADFMFTQNLPKLDTVFKNELKSIDLDVARLQIAYVDTLLVSPIDGVITGVSCTKGDCVRASQPVIRVENDTEVLLVGTLKFRGLVSNGLPLVVTTKIFDTPTTKEITGSVVSVRGHDSEDELWDVLILCKNRDSDGKAILPINYNFDFDDTQIQIS